MPGKEVFYTSMLRASEAESGHVATFDTGVEVKQETVK